MIDSLVTDLLAELKRLGTKATREGMVRFGIPAGNAFGVKMNDIKTLAKPIRKQHELALALYDTGQYEARMLAVFVDDPAQVTSKQMDDWCKTFDSWAACDHACFHLFDRTPFAFTKVKSWAKRKPEFEKRAAFALLAGMALHLKKMSDDPFADCLPLIEAASTDDRNFVKKGVSWALRGYGRRGAEVRSAAIALARKLAESESKSARWIGKDALRDWKL